MTKRFFLAILAALLCVSALSSATAESTDGQSNWRDGMGKLEKADVENYSVYRNLEFQGVQLAYLLHEAQVMYYDEHGTWAEYQSDLDGYLNIPAVMLEHADFKFVAMHNLELPDRPVVAYDGEILTWDPNSQWQYGCIVDQWGRIVDVIGGEMTTVTVSSAGTDVESRVAGCIWPEPVLSDKLPETRRLMEKARELSQSRGIVYTGPGA